MRFKSLHLKAFGPFEDKKLDFSGPGLQLIIGDNGAGKSTTMRALRGLLFGIPEQTDGWRNGKMQIGGQLTHSGQELELFRKRTKNLSTDIYDSINMDKKLDAVELAHFIGSISASAYSTLFVIDALEIEDGGKALLTGDVGAALFAATSGTNALPNVINALKAESNELFKPKARSPEINQCLKGLRTLRTEYKTALIGANQWNERLREESAAQSAFEKVKSELEAIDTKKGRAQRIRGVIGHVGSLRQSQIDLEEVKDTPLLDEDASQRSKDAQRTKDDASNTIKEADSKIESTRSALEAATFDQRLVDLEPTLESLNDQRAVTHKAVIEDLPDRNSDYDKLSGQALTSLQKVHPTETDLSNIDAFIPTTALKIEIQKLIKEHSRISVQLETCKKQVEEQSTAAARLKSADTSNEGTPDTKRLAAAISTAQKEGRLEEELRTAQAASKSAFEKANRLAAALNYVGDDPEAIAKLPLPADEETRIHDDAIGAASEAVLEAKREADQLRKQLADLRAELAELEATSEVPTLADRNAAREERETVWSRIRSIWVGDASLEETETAGGLAENLETATSTADLLADRISEEAEQVAAKQALITAIDRASSEEVTALSSIKAVEETLTSAEKAWGAIWKPTKITPASPTAMREWMTSQRTVVDAWEASVKAELEVARLEQAIVVHKESLDAALVESNQPPLGAKETLEQALVRAEANLEELRSQAESRRQTAADLETAKTQLVGYQDALAIATRELTEWQAKWAKPLERISLEPSLTPDAAQAVLNDLDEAIKARQLAAEQDKRRTDILQERDKFHSYLKGLAATVGLERELNDDPITAASQLAAMVTEAVNSSSEARYLTSNLADSEETRRVAKLKFDGAEAELRSLMQAAKVDNLEDLAEAEKRSATRARLEESIKKAEAELLGGSQRPLDEVIAEAEGADADSLEAEVEQLKRDFTDKSHERDEVHERLIEAKGATAASDNTSAAAQAVAKSKSIAADGAALVERYARLIITEVVLSRAVTANLEASQGPIVHRAGELFAELTDNRFSGLKVEWDGQEPTLEATQPDTEIPANLLSDGERDSLYLALRLAAIEQRSSESEGMPLLLDDILVNLDDRRTSAALKVLARVAESTQVLLFSHHPHVAELANKTLPSTAFSTIELAGNAPISA